MSQPRRRGPSALLVLTCALLLPLTACNPGDDMPTRAELEDPIRTDVTEVAALIGENVELIRDTWGACDVGRPQDGEYFRYTVHVDSRFHSFAQVMDELWPQLESAGWTLRETPPRPLFFRIRRNERALMANMSGLDEGIYKVAITGSTRCCR